MACIRQGTNFPKSWDVLDFEVAIRDVTGGNAKIKQGDVLEIGKYPVIDQGKSSECGYVNDEHLLCNEELPAILFGDHTKIFKYVTRPFVLGADGVKVLSPRATLDKRFLFHFLNTLALPDNAGYSRHYKFLKEAKIPVPPLSEQNRIAAILDKADAIRRKRQQAIQLADDFLRAVFLDMFGDPMTNPKDWPKGTFLDICQLNPRANKYDNNLFVSFVPMQDVSENSPYIQLKERRHYSEVKTGYTAFNEGDVLLAKITPCMENGKAGIAQGLENNVGFGSTEFHVFRPNRSEYAEFIYSIIHLESFRKLAASNFSGAVGHKRVPKDFLEKLPIYLPPHDLINEYSDIFKRTQAFLKKLSKNEINMNNLFNSLSQSAFSGKITNTSVA